jgi:CRP-like cAMP-binding protein
MANDILTARSGNGFLQVAAPRKPRTPYGFPAVDDCSSCGWRSERYFCHVSARTGKALEEIRRTSSYPAGAILFMEGEPARGVYIRCPGRVKLLTTNSDGKTLIFKIAKPDEILALNAALAGIPHEITAETLQPAQMTTSGGLRVKLALTHEEIAQLIGCSRESVSRGFSDFKRRHILEINGSTLLAQDKGALETLATL